MGINIGDCKTCGQRNVNLFVSTDECISCSRISFLEIELKSVRIALTQIQKDMDILQEVWPFK